MAHKSVFAFKDAGHNMPKEFLSLAMREGDTHTAVSVILPGPNGERKLKLFGSEKTSVEDFTKSEKVIKPEKALISFGHYDQGYLPEDLQPFAALKSADGKDLRLMACLEGNFENHARKGSNHTPEYHAYQELKERLESLDDAVDGDLDKLFQKLDGAVWKKDISGLWKDRGAVLLFGANGKSKLFSSNDKEGQFVWGYVSNKLGYNEKPAATAPTPPVQKKNEPKSLAEQMAEASETETETPVEEEEVDGEGQTLIPEKKDNPPWEEPPTTETTPTQETGVWVQAPAGLKLKKYPGWYRSNAGFIPEKPESRPKVLSRLARHRSFQDAAPDLAKVAEATQTAKASDVKKEEAPSLEVPMQLTAQDKTEIKGLFSDPSMKKYLDTSSREISDPEKWFEAEARFPTFAEANGIPGGMEYVLGLPYGFIHALAMTNPNGMALLFANLRSEHFRQKAELEKLKGKYGTKEEKKEEIPASRSSAHPGTGGMSTSERLAAMRKRA